MDPLLDEKIVLTLNRVAQDFFKDNLYISAEKEAYGPSKNEGLCYESCSRIGFSGDVSGYIYFCMDGYTKLKLLPRIAERYGVDAGLRGMADSIILEFANQMASLIVEELKDGGFQTELLPPETLNHKLVPIDLRSYRQYILIFFLRDRRERSYKGRLYLVLTMRKFGQPDDAASSAAHDQESAAEESDLQASSAGEEEAPQSDDASPRDREDI